MHIKKYSLNQRGYVLLPVLSLIALIAIFVYMSSRSISVDREIYETNTDKDRAFYVARAGLQHTLWKIKEQNICYNYIAQELNTTPFSDGNYSTTIFTSFGSPMEITANGQIPTKSFPPKIVSNTIDSNTTITKTVTIVLRPDAKQGKDTYLSSAPKDVAKNFGAEATLNLSNQNNVINPLIEFDLTSLPALTQVVSAQLSLYLEKGKKNTTATVEVYRVMQPWNEGIGIIKKPPANIDGATWTTYDGNATHPWLLPGGDINSSLITSIPVDGTQLKPYYWDIKSLAQEWVDDNTSNNGMLLKTDGAGTVTNFLFSSSDSPTCSQRPKLTLKIQCDCNQNQFSTTGLNLWGMTYLPGGITYMGTDNRNIDKKGGPAWIFVDVKPIPPNWLYLTDIDGSPMGTVEAPVPYTVHDLTRITTGLWTNHLAFTDGPNGQVYFVDITTGMITDIVNLTNLANSAKKTPVPPFKIVPMGITSIENTLDQDCTFNGYLAITSEFNSAGVPQGTLFIFNIIKDKKGVIVLGPIIDPITKKNVSFIERSIISNTTNIQNPRGIIHQVIPDPATGAAIDTLLIVDATGLATNVNFNGDEVKSFDISDFGISSPQVQGLGVSSTTCHPTVNDAGSQQIIDLP